MRIISGFLVFLMVFLGACAVTEQQGEQPIEDSLTASSDAPLPVEADMAPGWRSALLTDVVTEEEFTLESFAGPVLVESFAVWCPSCLKQQQIMQTLEIQHVSLNTDPNEDAEKVRAHVLTHGFEGRYAVAPAALTQSLIEDFGVGVVHAPSVPIILLCPSGEAHLLGRGVKSADTLKAEVAKGC